MKKENINESNENTNGLKRFRDYKTRVMDSEHVLFLTKEQASMLSERNLTKAILMADFGGGKSEKVIV